MVVYRLDGPVEMEIETTLKLTSLLRAAVLRRAQDTGPTIPEVLSGHDEQGKPSPSRYFSPEDWRDGSAVGIKRIATTSCYQLRRPPRHDTL
jgi:hypothetical protein